MMSYGLKFKDRKRWLSLRSLLLLDTLVSTLSRRYSTMALKKGKSFLVSHSAPSLRTSFFRPKIVPSRTRIGPVFFPTAFPTVGSKGFYNVVFTQPKLLP